MNGIYYYLIAFIVIWILAFGLKNKLTNHGFEIQFPLIMWRTEKFKNFIKRMANLSPKFWKCSTSQLWKCISASAFSFGKVKYNHTEYHSVPKPYPRISALLHNSPFANRPVPRRHRLLPNWDG